MPGESSARPLRCVHLEEKDRLHCCSIQKYRVLSTDSSLEISLSTCFALPFWDFAKRVSRNSELRLGGSSAMDSRGVGA